MAPVSRRAPASRRRPPWGTVQSALTTGPFEPFALTGCSVTWTCAGRSPLERAEVAGVDVLAALVVARDLDVAERVREELDIARIVGAAERAGPERAYQGRRARPPSPSGGGGRRLRGRGRRARGNRPFQPPGLYGARRRRVCRPSRQHGVGTVGRSPACAGPCRCCGCGDGPGVRECGSGRLQVSHTRGAPLAVKVLLTRDSLASPFRPVASGLLPHMPGAGSARSDTAGTPGAGG